MENAQITNEIINKLQLLSQKLEDIGVNVEDFENVLDRMVLIIADMRKVDSSDKYRFLPLMMIDEYHIEVDAWHSKVDLGNLDTECIEKKPIYQCLSEFFQNKTKTYEKLMEALVHELDLAITWLSNNREKITKLNEIKDEIDEIYKRFKQDEEEDE